MVADPNGSADQNLPVHSAATFRGKRFAQTIVLLVHDAARFGFAVDLDTGRSDGKGRADRGGQVYPFDQQVGPAQPLGQVNTQLATGIGPGLGRKEGDFALAGLAVFDFRSATG